MGIGEKGRRIFIELGLELVEDLLDGEGLVCGGRLSDGMYMNSW